ncbi:MAG: hypothetical protein WBP72_01120 [Rhodocyclaceae bacterium]
MFIPQSGSSAATAPRLLEGPRAVVATVHVPAIRDVDTEDARQPISADRAQASGPHGVVPPASEGVLIDQNSADRVEAANYACLTDAQGRFYLIDAGANETRSGTSTSTAHDETKFSLADTYAERALRSYAMASADFFAMPSRLSLYI